MPHYVLDARTASPHFPGIGRYVTSLISPLVQALHDGERLTLLIPADTELTLPDSEKVALRIVPDSPFGLSQQWTVPSVLKHMKADLYHSPYLLMPYLPGIPTVLTVHDIIPLLFPEQSTWRARTLFSLSLRLALRASQGIAYNSQTTRRDTERIFSIKHKHSTVTPLAAAPHFQPVSIHAIDALRKKHNLPARYLLYVGSNKPHKNLDVLVRAYAQVRTSIPECPALVIAGHWDARYPGARHLAHALDLAESVHWTGSQDEEDLPALFCGANLFVFPSLYEGFGLPPLEAMACGTPVICADIPALREVSGDAALRFDPHNVGELARLLETVLQDKAMLRDFRQRGLARAREFSWERTAQQTLGLYRQVCTTAKTRGTS